MKEGVNNNTETAHLRTVLLSLLTVSFYVLSSSASYALGEGIVRAANNAAGVAINILPSLGTMAIIALGISAMFGRITWTQALGIAIGVAIATSADLLFNEMHGADSENWR